MDEGEMLELSNDDLSEAIRVALEMTTRTGTMNPCHNDLCNHLRVLLIAQQGRSAAAIGQQMKEQT